MTFKWRPKEGFWFVWGFKNITHGQIFFYLKKEGIVITNKWAVDPEMVNPFWFSLFWNQFWKRGFRLGYYRAANGKVFGRIGA